MPAYGLLMSNVSDLRRRLYVPIISTVLEQARRAYVGRGSTPVLTSFLLLSTAAMTRTASRPTALRSSRLCRSTTSPWC